MNEKQEGDGKVQVWSYRYRRYWSSSPKTNYILVVDEGEDGASEQIKTKLTSKGTDTCCIDDDSPKRSKKLEEMEGGVLLMDKDKTIVRHQDMIDCATKGIEGHEVYAWRIEAIKKSGTDAHQMMTHKHTKKTFCCITTIYI